MEWSPTNPKPDLFVCHGFSRLEAIASLTKFKRILDLAMMKLAGRKGWYAAVIRHSGFRLGREYETPILAEPTPDGFLILLPYGEDVDWLKNVLVAGKCEIENKGVSYSVAEPEVVDREEAASFLPSRLRRQLGLYGVDTYLKVKHRAGLVDRAAHEVEQRKEESPEQR